MVISFDIGMQIASGNIWLVTRTWVRPSFEVAQRDHAQARIRLLDIDLGAGIFAQQLGHRDVGIGGLVAELLAVSLLRVFILQEAVQERGVDGSMPTSSACSQLHSHRPLKANTWLSGAVKQSSSGNGGGAPSPM
jgi:hypothetical protein